MNKKERQAATARMTKCACGNVARLGSTQCSACADRDQERDIQQTAHDDLRRRILSLPGNDHQAAELRDILIDLLNFADQGGRRIS